MLFSEALHLLLDSCSSKVFSPCVCRGNTGRELLKAKNLEHTESLLLVLTALLYAGFGIAGLACYVVILLTVGL